jgi:hypothetical protein
MRPPVRSPALLVCLLVAGLHGCVVDTAPEGLRATPPGPGARVVYDVNKRPLPDVPLPSDLATFADPTSRTGRRVNVSMVAPTLFEQSARSGINELEGWGTFMAVWLSFAKSELGDPKAPAIDLQAVRDRMPKGEFSFEDDPIYVINLKTGVPIVLDMGSGSIPVVLREPHRYGVNDLADKESNLLFETREEGAGLTQADYRPELDTDFDGVIDHPNTFGPAKKDGYDNLLTWYERETDTLILRPLLPLDEKTEYAVVLTDRLVGSDGRPVRSPFPAIHHPTQRDGAARVREILSDAARKSYYGDVAGTGLDHVAFTWTFTTQPVQEDLRLLRDGLHQRGPFARLGRDFPPRATAFRVAGPNGDAEPDGSPACQKRAKNPYLVKLSDPEVRDLFVELVKGVTSGSAGTLAELERGLEWIDHLVVGEFDSPYLMGDPDGKDPDAHFQLNYRTGEGPVARDRAQFVLWVPKAGTKGRQPFPVAHMGHGYGGNHISSYIAAGDWARQGIATVSINLPLHALVANQVQKGLISGIFAKGCLAALGGAVADGRALDLNGDGTPDNAWWFWTPHFFRVRDNVRQSLVDMMQLTRILKTFDGVTRGTQDLNGDGQPELAGDFDADGVPDVGGSAPITSTGASLGGIVSQIHGGIDHLVAASAPLVGGGSLGDIGMRSYGVATAVIQQGMTPIVVSVPVGEKDGKPKLELGTDGSKKNDPTRCAIGQRSVRIVVNDGGDSVHVELACLPASEIDDGMTAIVHNTTTGESRCAAVWQDGATRMPLPATRGDRLAIEIFRGKHAVTSYGTCELRPGVELARRIDRFEVSAAVSTPIAREGVECPGDQGCAQFQDTLYPVGSPLVSPQDGLGLRRQTPQFRRLAALAQLILDPADPVNFAPYYALRTLVDPDGRAVPPRGVLNVPSAGDNYVATASGIAFSRAAGAVPIFPPAAAAKYPEYLDYVTPQALYDAFGGRTPNQVLVDSYATEGIHHLERTPAGAACRASTDACKTKYEASVCSVALTDVDWVSEGRLPFDQQHPASPLRLTRRADMRVRTPADLAEVWRPRVAGAPFSTSGFAQGPPLVGQMLLYSDPRGAHGPEDFPGCPAFRPPVYVIGLLGRFLATGGTDVLYVTRPSGHLCLADRSCDFIERPPE